MNVEAMVWLVLAIIFLIIEANTVAMVSLWFCAGAIGAMIAAFLNAPVYAQIIVFVVVSALMLAALRPFVRKYFNPKVEKTNIDAVIGSVGTVIRPIDNIEATGQVKLSGMEWTARSTSGAPIPQGTIVKVDRVEGVKVFVTPEESKIKEEML